MNFFFLGLTFPPNFILGICGQNYVTTQAVTIHPINTIKNTFHESDFKVITIHIHSSVYSLHKYLQGQQR